MRKVAKRPASLIVQISSGGVIFRKRDDAYEVALIKIKNGDNWCLPKGLIDKGETPDQTARREVREETGLTGDIVEKLGEISYWYYLKDENAKCKKTVHFFLMEYRSGSTEDHDFEVETAQWKPLAEALENVKYKGEREMIGRAIDILKKRQGQKNVDAPF